jgi:hypothetical protein
MDGVVKRLTAIELRLVASCHQPPHPHRTRAKQEIKETPKKLSLFSSQKALTARICCGYHFWKQRFIRDAHLFRSGNCLNTTVHKRDA